MQTETLQKHQNWMSLSGRILEGGFELKDLIEADDNRALFRARVLGDRELVATAVFLRLSPAISKHEIEIWEAVRALRDPRLNSPLGCGLSEVDGARTTFVVLRQPDESLAGVLRERALTPAEMKDALLSVAKGLEVLHRQGFVHGSIAPAQVLALGETIRLSGEGVRVAGAATGFDFKPAQYLAPESTGINLTVESDIWCLGATIFESLTQKLWAESERSDIDALPEPFASIALRCLGGDPSRRCKLTEVVALARGEMKPTPRPKPVPVPVEAAAESVPVAAASAAAAASVGADVRPKPAESIAQNGRGSSPKETHSPEAGAQARAAASGATAENSAANGVGVGDAPIVEKSVPREKVEARGPIRQPMPVVGKRPVPKVQPIQNPVSAPDLGVRRERVVQREEFEPESRFKIWIWAGAGLLVVLLLIWALRPKTHVVGKVVPGPTTSTTASAAQSKVPVNSWETKTIQPDGTAVISAGADKSKADATKGAHAVVAKTGVAAKAAESAPAANRVWRIVLYTYKKELDAKEKVKSLNAKHSNLHAEVFSPSGSGAPYLVSAGGRVSREEALQIRKKAISLGMPRDTYIQNYSH